MDGHGKRWYKHWISKLENTLKRQKYNPQRKSYDVVTAFLINFEYDDEITTIINKALTHRCDFDAYEHILSKLIIYKRFEYVERYLRELNDMYPNHLRTKVIEALYYYECGKENYMPIGIKETDMLYNKTIALCDEANSLLESGKAEDDKLDISYYILMSKLLILAYYELKQYKIALDLCDEKLKLCDDFLEKSSSNGDEQQVKSITELRKDLIELKSKIFEELGGKNFGA
jgi:tetratricopeptide (TPR) repeat protein